MARRTLAQTVARQPEANEPRALCDRPLHRRMTYTTRFVPSRGRIRVVLGSDFGAPGSRSDVLEPSDAAQVQEDLVDRGPEPLLAVRDALAPAEVLHEEPHPAVAPVRYPREQVVLDMVVQPGVI